jgi:hypothetical protein
MIYFRDTILILRIYHISCFCASARGIEAKPPAKHGTCDAGDVADSPTRGHEVPEAARPKF